VRGFLDGAGKARGLASPSLLQSSFAAKS